MEITISNIGKISNANISLGDITVIAGINSSGKTTVAKVMAGMLNPLSNLSLYVDAQRKQSIDSKIYEWLSSISNNLFFNAYYSSQKPAAVIYQHLALNNKPGISTEDLFDLFFEGKRSRKPSQEKAGILVDQINSIIQRKDSDYYDRIFELSLSSFFNNQMVTNGEVQGSIFIDGSVKCQISDKKIKMQIANQNELINRQVVYISTGFSFKDWPFSDVEPNSLRHIVLMDRRNRKQFKSITDQLAKPIIQNNSGVSFEEYKEVIDQVPVFKESIEQIVNGYIDVNSEKGTTFIDGNKASINLCNVATGVLPFATIERLIENGTLRRNSILIIDEPETHLHPQWQVIFGKLLCEIAQKLGVRIVVLSHSPYLIRSIEREIASGMVQIESKFYLMSNTDDGKDLTKAKDVTDSTDEIYYQLYKPLEQV